MTLRQALLAAAAQLAGDVHLLAQARSDAELLLLHTLQIPRANLLAHPERAITKAQQSAYADAIARRLLHEPIQYITGHQEFYGLDLQVTPAVLIPRPETEHLVEAVLTHFKSFANHPIRIADVGTGSGAIAIALAVHLPQAQITALDLSPEALHIAEANVRQHNLAHRIRLLRSDLLSALTPESQTSQPFDAIVSNPPYIPDSDAPHLHPQVRDYEPPTALFAGSSGLEIYRRLIPQARAALKPDGLLALEIGHGQRPALTDLLVSWQNVAFINDLQQIPRVVLARTKAVTSPVQP